MKKGLFFEIEFRKDVIQDKETVFIGLYPILVAHSRWK